MVVDEGVDEDVEVDVDEGVEVGVDEGVEVGAEVGVDEGVDVGAEVGVDEGVEVVGETVEKVDGVVGDGVSNVVGEMVGENVRVQFKSSWPVQFVQVCRLMLQWSSLSQHADLKYSLLNSGHVYFMVFILTSAHSLYDVSKGQHPPS